MMRPLGDVFGGVVRVEGRDVARFAPEKALEAIDVTGDLPMVVRSVGGRSGRLSWIPSEVSAFEASVDEFVQRARASALELWWRPTCEDVLSDVPSTQSFFRRRSGFGLVLDPGAMMTDEMMPRADEHAQRVLEALGAHEALRLVVVRKRAGEVVERLMEKLVPLSVPMVRIGDGVEGVGLH